MKLEADFCRYFSAAAKIKLRHLEFGTDHQNSDISGGNSGIILAVLMFPTVTLIFFDGWKIYLASAEKSPYICNI